MPEPSSLPTYVPDGFDPAIHCGSLTNAGTPCMLRAGYDTDHKGSGACRRHGGGIGHASLTTGEHSKFPERRLPKLLERAREIRDSDDLLVIDTEISVLKAVFEAEAQEYAEKYEQFAVLKAAIEAGDYDEEGAQKPVLNMPELDTETLNTMTRLIKVAYDMRFAKRFSVPVQELESIVAQILMSFNEVCELFGIGNDVKVAFAERLSQLHLSRQTDYQLERAGGVKRAGSGGEIINDVAGLGAGVEVEYGEAYAGAAGGGV